MPKKVLIVDDDRSILDVARRYLAQNGFSVVVAENGSDALLLARDAAPDAVVVDARMPDVDGASVCRMLRKNPATKTLPIIIMSGEQIKDEDVVSGLAGGADDYLIKPFSLAVLKARIDAVLRRARPEAKAEAKLRAKGLEIDAPGRVAKVAGKRLDLTRKEFDLLAALVDKTGRVLSVPFLLETVWGYDPARYNDPGTVEVHVSHLRKKLGSALGKRIVNFPGHGYKFE
jgi:DNA-binding response OmpR family regulator